MEATEEVRSTSITVYREQPGSLWLHTWTEGLGSRAFELDDNEANELARQLIDRVNQDNGRAVRDDPKA